MHALSSPIDLLQVEDCHDSSSSVMMIAMYFTSAKEAGGAMMRTNDGTQTIVVDAVDGRNSNTVTGFTCVFSLPARLYPSTVVVTIK